MLSCPASSQLVLQVTCGEAFITHTFFCSSGRLCFRSDFHLEQPRRFQPSNRIHFLLLGAALPGWGGKGHGLPEKSEVITDSSSKHKTLGCTFLGKYLKPQTTASTPWMGHMENRNPRNNYLSRPPTMRSCLNC